MKNLTFFFLAVIGAAALVSCSDDNEVKRKGDADIVHEGAQWNIASVDYMLIDQTTSSQTFKNGTKQNAGTFYFVEGGAQGSFEMEVEGYNKEDYFNYSIENGSVSIIDIEQNVGKTTNQNVLVISGESSATEMMLNGTITKQSLSGQFVLTVEMTLTKR